MALLECPECKKTISELAKACPFCGFPIKKKGRASAITSMILGIYSCFYTLPFLYFPAKELGKGLFPTITIGAVASILSIVFGYVSLKQKKHKMAISGIVMGSICLVILCISFLR